MGCESFQLDMVLAKVTRNMHSVYRYVICNCILMVIVTFTIFCIIILPAFLGFTTYSL